MWWALEPEELFFPFKKQLNVLIMPQWISAWSYGGQWLCALEQEISDSSKDDDVCRDSYITGAEHFVCHSYKVTEGDMNTSRSQESCAAYCSSAGQIVPCSPRVVQYEVKGMFMFDVHNQHVWVCIFRLLLLSGLLKKKAHISLLEIHQLFTIQMYDKAYQAYKLQDFLKIQTTVRVTEQ